MAHVSQAPPVYLHRILGLPWSNLLNLFAILGLNLFFCERNGMPLEHFDSLLHRHADLCLPNGNHALGKVRIVLGKQLDRHHQVVDVVKDQCPIRGIGVLGLEKGSRVVAPMSHRVQVVRGVVTVIEAVAVALKVIQVLATGSCCSGL